MPFLADVRDAVVKALNAGGLSPPVNAVPAYDAILTIQTFTGARLLVMPREISGDLLTHDDDQERDFTIRLILQYKPPAITVENLDPYLALAESIDELMIGQQLPVGSVNCTCTEIQWPDGAWNQDDLEKYQVFSTTLDLAFKRID